MTRGSREVGTIKLGILSAALIAGLALPANADDKKLTLSATTAFTTDYVFRGVSQTTGGPAVQPEFDLYYGMFYAGIWGSNIEFQHAGPGTSPGDIEIDYYVGITPKWKNITFNIAGLYYTYPGYCETKCGLAENDYFEVKTGASYTFAEKLTLSVTNYWSPEFAGESGEADAVEGSVGYAFGNKLFNFFSPTISGLVGYQTVDLYGDYTYWNVGLTLGFMEHWSADVRYWDTDASSTVCTAYSFLPDNCDERVVGTLKAVF